jgi:trehalose synthase
VLHGTAESTVWHVNTTKIGGGVAELVIALTSTDSDDRFKVARFVTSANSEVFAMMKRLHHQIHGVDCGTLPTPAEDRHYITFALAHADRLIGVMSPGDVVILHDPHTLAMAPLLLDAGFGVAWRCHIGTSKQNNVSSAAWSYLSTFLRPELRMVFSDETLIPPIARRASTIVIPPSINPSATKNMPLTSAETRQILARNGLDGPQHDTASESTISVISEMPLGTDPVILQVSRWDPLKDMAGVLMAFVESALPRRAHLVLCGPRPGDVVDDPEAAGVLSDVVAMREQLPVAVRRRVHIVCPTLTDERENALGVNALQRRATVVTQKSLQEGFGLTVTEAMWKGRPVVASKVGGLCGQVIHGVTGLLLDDPNDRDAFSRLVVRILDDPAEASRLGAAAHRRAAGFFTLARERADHDLLYQSLASAVQR